MLSYFISQSNYFSIRTETMNSSSLNLTASLENMYSYVTQSVAISASTFISYNQYESILSFSLDLGSSITADEYYISILNGSSVSASVYSGTIQVYEPQIVSKSEYLNQNQQYKSHNTSNEYIIY